MGKTTCFLIALLCLTCSFSSLLNRENIFTNFPTGNGKKSILSIEDAIQTAFRNRRDLEAYIYAKRASKNSERGALAGYFPQIQLSTNLAKTAPSILYDSNGLSQKFCPDTTSNRGVSFNFSQLIFDGGGPVLDYRIAKESTNVLRAEKRQLKQSIKIGTVSSYLELQKILLQKDFYHMRDKSSKLSFALNSGRRAVGQLSNTDWLSALSEYTSEQSAIANYPFEIESAVSSLERELNEHINPEQLDLSVEGIAAVELEPLDYYIMLSIKNRPDLEAQKYRVKQANLREKKYKRVYLPTVNIYAQASDVKLGRHNSNRTASWSAGVELGWNFDGLGSAHTSRLYKNQKTQYLLQEKDLELQIRNDVISAFFQTKKLINQLKAAQFDFERAQSRLRSNETRFKIGSISQSDFAQVEVDYEQSRYSLDSLKIDVRGSYQNLLFVCGYPKELQNHM